jgi:hypothetical protein
MIEKGWMGSFDRKDGIGSTSRMMVGIAVAFALAVLCAACTDPEAPPAPTPATPTITETFTGTLNPFGTNFHPFTVQQIGGLKVTVNSVVPSAAVGVAIGTPSPATGTCIPIAALSVVGGPDAQLSGTATINGNYCIAVSDVGNLVEAVNYTITVLHS